MTLARRLFHQAIAYGLRIDYGKTMAIAAVALSSACAFKPGNLRAMYVAKPSQIHVAYADKSVSQAEWLRSFEIESVVAKTVQFWRAAGYKVRDDITSNPPIGIVIVGDPALYEVDAQGNKGRKLAEMFWQNTVYLATQRDIDGKVDREFWKRTLSHGVSHLILDESGRFPGIGGPAREAAHHKVFADLSLVTYGAQ